MVFRSNQWEIGSFNKVKVFIGAHAAAQELFLPDMFAEFRTAKT